MGSPSKKKKKARTEVKKRRKSFDITLLKKFHSKGEINAKLLKDNLAKFLHEINKEMGIELTEGDSECEVKTPLEINSPTK